MSIPLTGRSQTSTSEYRTKRVPILPPAQSVPPRGRGHRFLRRAFFHGDVERLRAPVEDDADGYRKRLPERLDRRHGHHVRVTVPPQPAADLVMTNVIVRVSARSPPTKSCCVYRSVHPAAGNDAAGPHSP